MKPDLIVIKDLYAIFRYSNPYENPDWTESPDFYSFTRTRDEISIVCKQDTKNIPGYIAIDKNWRIIKVNGPLNLSLTGIIAGISGILAKNRIPLFTISTYNTDYILIKEINLDKAINALKKDGYRLSSEEN